MASEPKITLVDFVWETHFTDKGGVQVLCGVAKDKVTRAIIPVTVRKATIDTMASDYTKMEFASGAGVTDGQ